MTSLRKNLAALLLGALIVQNTILPLASIAYAEEGDTAAIVQSSDSSETNTSEEGESVVQADGADEAEDSGENQSDVDTSVEEEDGDSTNTDAVEETNGEETATDVETSTNPDTVADSTGENSTTTEPTQSSGGGGSASESVPSENDEVNISYAEVTGTSTPGTISTSTIPVDLLASTTAATTTTATATSTGPVIQSGESVALANILNIVNTNIVNSTGNALLLNYTDQVTGPIDLRNGTPVFSTSTASCALFACASTQGVSVNLSADADIHNAVVLNATTGGNEIDSAGNAIISTGNALAGLNLINIANTNIVDSNYLLVTLNAFRGVQGDIVFPSLTNLLSSLAQSLAPGYVSVTGDGTVNNTVVTDANSGNNQTGNTASSTIATGNSSSSGSVFNQLNTNMVGGTAVSILFRIQGSWAGRVFGAPEGLQWIQGPDGMVALFDASPSGSGSQSLSQITSSSTANIDNDVNVVALTGDNRIENSDSALITTGDALASANVLNIANTNIVGKNWIMAIVNIFGDFTGDIAFGRPDLWVGEQVEVPSFVQNGSNVTYKFSVINNGDSVASNVRLTDSFDRDHVDVQSSSAEYTLSGNTMVWDLGTIPAGGAVEVTYEGRIKDTTEGTNITNTVSTSGYETDNNVSDNTDTATFSASYSQTSREEREDEEELSDEIPAIAVAQPATMIIERATAAGVSQDGQSVQEKIVVRNTGTAASAPATIHDLLHAPDGSIISGETWDVPAIGAGEGVELEYMLNFSSKAPSGIYSLSTVILDQNGNELRRFVGNGKVKVTNVPAGKILGLSTFTRGSIPSYEGSNTDSILDRVFPGIAVARAAGPNDAAAAAGFLTLSNVTLIGLGLMLLTVLGVSNAYRKRSR